MRKKDNKKNKKKLDSSAVFEQTVANFIAVLDSQLKNRYEDHYYRVLKEKTSSLYCSIVATERISMLFGDL